MTGEGTDKEALGLTFHHKWPTFINAYCQAAINLADRNRGEGNDLPQPGKNVLPFLKGFQKPTLWPGEVLVLM